MTEAPRDPSGLCVLQQLAADFIAGRAEQGQIGVCQYAPDGATCCNGVAKVLSARTGTAYDALPPSMIFVDGDGTPVSDVPCERMDARMKQEYLLLAYVRGHIPGV